MWHQTSYPGENFASMWAHGVIHGEYTLGRCRSAFQLRIERAERVLPHRHDRDAKLFRQQLPERLQFSSAILMEFLQGCSSFTHAQSWVASFAKVYKFTSIIRWKQDWEAIRKNELLKKLFEVSRCVLSQHFPHVENRVPALKSYRDTYINVREQKEQTH